jgi:hypothetical protein
MRSNSQRFVTNENCRNVRSSVSSSCRLPPGSAFRGATLASLNAVTEISYDENALDLAGASHYAR